jgi:ATP phosphoribosyltransferase
MLRIVLPKGSLERATLELFEQADLGVLRSSSVQYLAAIDDPRVAEVRILRPQEIPTYVAEGLFDIGITGRDWIEETESDVVSLGQLRYSKATSKPIRLVVAVAEDAPWKSAAELPNGVRISTEYMGITKRFFAGLGIEADVRLSYGATEAKVPDIADAVVEITETGNALRAAGLRVLDTVVTSYTELIANKAAYDDPAKRKAMLQIKTLLDGVMEARGKVLLKLNVSKENFNAVLQLVPSMGHPTVSPLAGNAGFAIETVVSKNRINVLIPDLVEAGATAILELPISKIIP